MNQNGGAEDCCFIRFCLSNRPTLKGCRSAYAGHGTCHSKGFGFWPTPQLLKMQPITKTLPIKFPKTNRRHRTIRHNHDTVPNPSNPITCRGSLTEQLTLQILAYEIGLTNCFPFYLYEDSIQDTLHRLNFLDQSRLTERSILFIQQ